MGEEEKATDELISMNEKWEGFRKRVYEVAEDG